jgi:hypothetical protein
MEWRVAEMAYGPYPFRCSFPFRVLLIGLGAQRRATSRWPFVVEMTPNVGLSLAKVVAVEVHDLAPGGYEVLHKRLFRVA